MNTPLQKTKLFLPTSRARLVERPRLVDRLNIICSEGCRLVLISAPAGSGKTTVIGQWLSQLDRPYGWVSLDTRDNSPARFFSYLIAALQTIRPGAGNEAQALLELPGANLEEVVTLLANDLAEPRLPLKDEPFILALDDFHTITNPALHHAVDLLLEAQPPQMHLVLISREDPVLQLARYRARGQLVELRQEDLRFTLPEAVTFLNQTMELNLSTSQVEQLEVRTEGWIAGLQMAALSLQRAKDVDQFIHDFSGSHRFILDYLMEEVLAHQPEGLQNFLLETSILERMCADLCESIIQDPPDPAEQKSVISSRITDPASCSAQSILEGLERSNLFVIPLDDERRWYRYHHLFGDLLLAHLQAKQPDRANELHRRASIWYEANGDPRLAVEHTLKAQDFARAADLIERHAVERWQTVDLEFIMLVNRLPQEVVNTRPSLCLQSAWNYVITGQPGRILPLVEAAERRLDEAGRLPEPSDAANRAFARTLRIYLTDLQNQPVELDESLRLAYAAIPVSNPGMRNSVAVVIGSIYYMEDDFTSALDYFRDALELDKRVNGTNAVPIAVMRIVWVFQAQGKLREAEQLLREHADYVRQRGNRRFYISGAINLLWGELLLEWNRLEEAETQIREGLRLLEDWPIASVLSLGWCLLSRLQMARGDLAAARTSLERVEKLQQQSRFYHEFTNAIERTWVHLWTAENNTSALETWASENAPLAGQEFHFRNETRRIELARAWLALGRKEEASALLQRLAGAASERNGRRVIILALLVAAYSAEPGRAIPILEEALRLGEPGGYLRTFVDAGEPVRQMVKAWLQHPRSKDHPLLREYAHRVLAAFEEPELGRPKPSAPPEKLAEPLSEREQEVLQLVAQGLTNQQIATRLVISIRTVKKHVENIHGKLGVQNRTQAVAHARALGLLKE
jgi:LuxR family maltose regulon positive regulatory protein